MIKASYETFCIAGVRCAPVKKTLGAFFLRKDRPFTNKVEVAISVAHSADDAKLPVVMSFQPTNVAGMAGKLVGKKKMEASALTAAQDTIEAFFSEKTAREVGLREYKGALAVLANEHVRCEVPETGQGGPEQMARYVLEHMTLKIATKDVLCRFYFRIGGSCGRELVAPREFYFVEVGDVYTFHNVIVNTKTHAGIALEYRSNALLHKNPLDRICSFPKILQRHPLTKKCTVAKGKHVRYSESMRCMQVLFPLEEWPHDYLWLFYGNSTIVWKGRLKIVSFLRGNGLPGDDIRAVLWHKLADQSAVNHLESIITSIDLGVYNHRWNYYNINAKDFLYQDNTPAEFCDSFGKVIRPINYEDALTWKRAKSSGW